MVHPVHMTLGRNQPGFGCSACESEPALRGYLANGSCSIVPQSVPAAVLNICSVQLLLPQDNQVAVEDTLSW